MIEIIEINQKTIVKKYDCFFFVFLHIIIEI